MKEKIELYREMLQQDPRSRAFFLLAEAFQEAGLCKEAVAVLREGLQWHPDFLEARMLLVQILFATGDESAISEAAPVASMLERYPVFWEALSIWAAGCSPKAPGSGIRSRIGTGTCLPWWKKGTDETDAGSCGITQFCCHGAVICFLFVFIR